MFEFLRQFYFTEQTLEMLKKPIIGDFLDLWTVIHFGTFYLIGRFFPRLTRNNIIFGLIGYEIFELYLLQQGLSTPESILNIILDVVAGYAGWRLSKNYN